MMNKRITVLSVLLLSVALAEPAAGQTCKELWRKAETLRKGENYDAAISTYQQVKECNDKSYVKDCNYAINWIKQNRPVKKSQQPVTFSLSTKDITLPYQGGEWIVRVYGGNAWTYSVDGDWCIVKKKGNQLIVSSAQENESTQPRKAKLKVQSGGKTNTVDITNEGAPEKLLSSVSTLNFPAQGENTDVDIYANIDWQVAEKASWVTAEKESEGHVRFTVEPNHQGSERQSVVKITSPSNAIIYIQINQGAGDEKLSFSKNNLLFGPDGGDEYVKVYTDASKWRFDNIPSWVQVSRVGDDMVRIHCAPNDPINEKREGSVGISTGLQVLGINIAQEAKPVSYLIPMPNIGGRKLSFGISASLVKPTISASSDGSFTGSPVNYSLANSEENCSYTTSMGFSVNAFADIHLYRNLYLQAGLGITHYTYKNEFEANVVRTVPQTTNLYLQGRTQNKYSEEYSMTMLEVPVLASYRFPITRISHVQLNLGPVVTYGLNAKLKLDGYTDSETMEFHEVKTGNRFGTDYAAIHYHGTGEFNLYDTSVDYKEKHSELGGIDVGRSQTLDDSPLSRLNVGLRAGVAFEYAGIGIGLEYTYMLTNMANKRFWDGDRWKIFDQNVNSPMSGYSERHHYLGIKIGYTFRY